MDIKELASQLDMIKTRAESIINSINEFPVHRMNDLDSIQDLMNDISGDSNAMDIHIETAFEIIQ